jgi:hypothetical protein
MRRIFLHAARLGFTHPITGEETIVESPLPEDLATVLADLGRSFPTTTGTVAP